MPSTALRAMETCCHGSWGAEQPFTQEYYELLPLSLCCVSAGLLVIGRGNIGSLSDHLHNHAHPFPAPHTEGGHSPLLPPVPEGIEEGYQQPGPGTAYGVAQGDSAPIYIHLPLIQPKLSCNRQGAGGEGLVYLMQVNILFPELRLLQHHRYGTHGAGGEDICFNASRAVGDDP